MSKFVILKMASFDDVIRTRCGNGCANVKKKKKWTNYFCLCLSQTLSLSLSLSLSLYVKCTTIKHTLPLANVNSHVKAHTSTFVGTNNTLPAYIQNTVSNTCVRNTNRFVKGGRPGLVVMG